MFSDEQFERIANVVVRANPDAKGRIEALCPQLSDLLINVGAADDGAAADMWFYPERNKPVDHPVLARHFAAIARARNPLGHPLCKVEMRQELAAAARLQWPELSIASSSKLIRNASARTLANCSTKDLRDLARSRAQYHASFVKRGQPSKQRLDTLIEQLAEIYAIITNFKKLGHTPSSRFVKFCHLVLAPFFDASEVTPKAIANRWKRLKDDAKRLPVPIVKHKVRKVRLKKRPARTRA